MAETFRTTKLEKFIAKQIRYMETQQRVIEEMRKLHGVEKADQLTASIQYNQIAWHNYTFELCKEFGLEMPVVLGLK